MIGSRVPAWALLALTCSAFWLYGARAFGTESSDPAVNPPECRADDPTFFTGAVRTQFGFDMVAVCRGRFLMGSPETEEGHGTHDPPGPRETQRRVTLTHDFWIGRTSVTQGQAVRFLGYDPSSRSTESGNLPVESVTWHEAAALANAVSTEAGLPLCYACSEDPPPVNCEAAAAYDTPYQCAGYRLPTSAELEYATRAGTTSAFSSGGDLAAGDGSDEPVAGTVGPGPGCRPGIRLTDGRPLSEIAWYCDNSQGKTHEVGQLAPNPWGLYDVHGNVYSWCHDWYGPAGSWGRKDPVGTDSSLGERVTRGGSWFVDAAVLRSAYRSSCPPDRSIDDLGVRLVRSLPHRKQFNPMGLALAVLALATLVGIGVVLRRRLSRHRG